MFGLSNHQENGWPLIVLVKISYFVTEKIAHQVLIVVPQSPHRNLGMEIQFCHPNAEGGGDRMVPRESFRES